MRWDKHQVLDISYEVILMSDPRRGSADDAMGCRVRSSGIVSGPFQVTNLSSVIVDVQNLGNTTTDVTVKLITWNSASVTCTGPIRCQTIDDLRCGCVGALVFSALPGGTYEVVICPKRRINLRGSVTETAQVGGATLQNIPAAAMMPDDLGLCSLTCTP